MSTRCKDPTGRTQSVGKRSWLFQSISRTFKGELGVAAFLESRGERTGVVVSWWRTGGFPLKKSPSKEMLLFQLFAHPNNTKSHLLFAVDRRIYEFSYVHAAAGMIVIAAGALWQIRLYFSGVSPEN